MRLLQIYQRLFILLIFSILLSGCDTLEQLPDSIIPRPTETIHPSITSTPTLPAAPVLLTPTPTGNPDKSKTITIWLPPDLNPQKQTIAGKLIFDRLQEFESLNPDIKINVRIKNLSGAQGMLDTLSVTTLAAPLAKPSILVLPQSDLETAVHQGLVYPIFSDENNIDDSDWYPYSQSMAKVDGKWYGVPYFGDALIIVYRNASTTDNITTWANIQGINQPVLFPASEAGSLTTLAFYQSLAGDQDIGNDPKNLNEEKLIQVFAFMQNNARQGIFSYSLSQYDRFDQTWTAFKNRQAHWVITWTSSYLSSTDTTVQAMPLPGLDETPFTLATGQVFVLSEPDQDRQVICMKLIDFLVEPGFLSKLNQASASIPTRLSADKFPNDLNKQTFFNQVSQSAHIQPTLASYITIANRMKDATTQVIKFQITPQEAAKLVINGEETSDN